MKHSTDGSGIVPHERIFWTYDIRKWNHVYIQSILWHRYSECHLCDEQWPVAIAFIYMYVLCLSRKWYENGIHYIHIIFHIVRYDSV